MQHVLAPCCEELEIHHLAIRRRRDSERFTDLERRVARVRASLAEPQGAQ